MEAILNILDQLIEVHRTLLELSEQKKRAIIGDQVDQLMQLTQKETKLVKRIEELETERMRAIEAFMRSKNMYLTSAITISQLTRFVVILEDKQALMDRQHWLLALIEELKRANDLNRQLIQQSLAFINCSLDLLVGCDESDAVYRNPSQSVPSAARSTLFDTKA